MIDLIFHEEDLEYEEDVKRIVRVFAEKGFRITQVDARLSWDKYSESMCAGWLMLPEQDGHLFEAVRPYFKGVSDD